MIHLDKVLSLKEPIIFTSHTILLFSDSSRVTWHDSQLKIIIICLLGPWRIFFSSPALKKTTKKTTTQKPFMPCPTLFLSLSNTTLTFKQAFVWLAQKVRTAGGFLFEGKKIHPCSLKSWVQQAFQLQQQEEKKCLSFNQFGCFLVWKLQKMRDTS